MESQNDINVISNNSNSVKPNEKNKSNNQENQGKPNNKNSNNKNHHGRHNHKFGNAKSNNNKKEGGNKNGYENNKSFSSLNKSSNDHRRHNSKNKKHENKNNKSQEKEINNSNSTDSEADENENNEIPQSVPIPIQPILVMCPYKDCNQDESPFMNPQNLQNHLEKKHNLSIKNIEHVVPFIEKYLCYWIEKMEKVDSLEEFGTKKDNTSNVYIIPNSNYENEDKLIREKYQREKLNEMLAIQDIERKESDKPRKCLFCKKVIQSRTEYFHHMFLDHNFNIGLPDNVVNVDEFLYILQAKLNGLQCLYCEKIFKASAVLRKHMRKKKHFKINPRNHIYDKFYIINYLEPGKNWENYENDRYYSDDEKDNEWDDWDEEIEDEPTMCLFDEYVASSTKNALEHMKTAHNFDFKKIKEDYDLDFYQCIMLINYIRRQTSLLKCYSCLEDFEDIEKLGSHLKETNHYTAVPSKDNKESWNNVNYMLPTYDDDPLLHGFNEFFDEMDEKDSENDISKSYVTAERMLIDEKLEKKKKEKKDFDTTNN